MLRSYAEDFITQYEENPHSINLYEFYANFKREIEGFEKVPRFKPLYDTPIDISKYTKTTKLGEENKTYLIQEKYWNKSDVLIQYIVKVWYRNNSDGLSQFEIVQVIFGNRFKNMLKDTVCDSDKTVLQDVNLSTSYGNQYTFRELTKMDLQEIMKR